MSPASSKKNWTNSNNSRVTFIIKNTKQQTWFYQIKQRKLNKEKKNVSTGSKNQTTREESQVAGKFSNSWNKYKLTTRKKSGQPLWNVLVKNLGFDQERVDSKIDNCHRLGKPNWKKQSTIICFKTCSFRAAVYEKQKIIRNKKLKVKLLLTKKRQAFQWIFWVQAINCPCKEVFSQIALVIYCLP